MKRTGFNFTGIFMSIILPTLIGVYILPYLLNRFGILYGEEGVVYYAEIHKSKFNSYIHTIFMPFTYLGFNMAVPAILGLSVRQALRLQLAFYCMYITHYMTIDIHSGILYAIIYAMPVLLAGNTYKLNIASYRYILIFMGLCISTTALLIQEIVGHYFGGDYPSRPEGVLNAILYANYYAIAHITQNY